MINGSQAIWAAEGVVAWGKSGITGPTSLVPEASPSSSASRLRKHADYQRVYKASRKHFSPSMSYFFCRRAPAMPEIAALVDPPRVGLTAGKVLGKAVDRNRIKRRMREAVRMNLYRLPAAVDVVLHPRKSVIEMEFGRLSAEVGRIFSTVGAQLDKSSPHGKPAEPIAASGKTPPQSRARAGTRS